MKPFLGNIYRHLASLFWSHWLLAASSSSSRMIIAAKNCYKSCSSREREKNFSLFCSETSRLEFTTQTPQYFASKCQFAAFYFLTFKASLSKRKRSNGMTVILHFYSSAKYIFERGRRHLGFVRIFRV